MLHMLFFIFYIYLCLINFMILLYSGEERKNMYIYKIVPELHVAGKKVCRRYME